MNIKTIFPWWAKEEAIKAQIEDGDHPLYLCGRKVVGDWEYALVRFSKSGPKLLVRFVGGHVVEPDTSPVTTSPSPQSQPK